MKTLFPIRFRRDGTVELRILLNHLRHSISLSQRHKLKRLGRQGNLRLNLGCGPRVFDGWVNVDAFPGGDIVQDLRRGLPFPGGSAEYIFHEHFMEHLDFYLEVPALLSECRRVLKPGGVMRVVVPDGEKFAMAYAAQTLDWFHQVEPGRNFRTCGEGLAFNFQYQGQHHSGWDFETLSLALHTAGFGEVQRTPYCGSPLTALNLETDSPVRALHSLCVNTTR